MGPNNSSKKYFDVAKPRSSADTPSTTPTLNNPKRQMINIADDEVKPPEESQPISNIDDENQPYTDTLMDQPEASEPLADSLSHPELVLASDDKNDSDSVKSQDNEPPTEDDSPKFNQDVPFVNPLPGTVQEEKPVEETADNSSSKEAENSQEKPSEEPKIDKTVGEKIVKPLEDSEKTDKPPEEKPQLDTPAPPPERFSAIDALPENQNLAEKNKEEPQDPSIYDTKEYYVPIGDTHHGHGGLKMAFAFGLLCAVVVVGAIIFYMFYFAK